MSPNGIFAHSRRSTETVTVTCFPFVRNRKPQTSTRQTRRTTRSMRSGRVILSSGSICIRMLVRHCECTSDRGAIKLYENPQNNDDLSSDVIDSILIWRTLKTAEISQEQLQLLCDHTDTSSHRSSRRRRTVESPFEHAATNSGSPIRAENSYVTRYPDSDLSTVWWTRILTFQSSCDSRCRCSRQCPKSWRISSCSSSTKSSSSFSSGRKWWSRRLSMFLRYCWQKNWSCNRHAGCLQWTCPFLSSRKRSMKSNKFSLWSGFQRTDVGELLGGREGTLHETLPCRCLKCKSL